MSVVGPSGRVDALPLRPTPREPSCSLRQNLQDVRSSSTRAWLASRSNSSGNVSSRASSSSAWPNSVWQFLQRSVAPEPQLLRTSNAPRESRTSAARRLRSDNSDENSSACLRASCNLFERSAICSSSERDQFQLNWRQVPDMQSTVSDLHRGRPSLQDPSDISHSGSEVRNSPSVRRSSAVVARRRSAAAAAARCPASDSLSILPRLRSVNSAEALITLSVAASCSFRGFSF